MAPTPPSPRAPASFAEGRRQVASLRADDLLPLPLHLTARILAAVGARADPGLRVAWAPPRAALRLAAAVLVLAAGALTVVGLEPLAAVAGASEGWWPAEVLAPTAGPRAAIPTDPMPSDWLAPSWAASLADRAGGAAGLVALGLASLGLALFSLARVRAAGGGSR